MILVKAYHYLTPEGMKYFPSWFDKLFSVIKIQEGYGEITYRVDKQAACAIILLLFSDTEKLTQWAKSAAHHSIVGKLDPYRTQPWKSERKTVEE